MKRPNIPSDQAQMTIRIGNANISISLLYDNSSYSSMFIYIYIFFFKENFVES